MARLKTADKELAILEAASRVFAQRPFHEVLIDDIASDAGIGKGTIYRYFETKDDLYFNAVLHVLDTLTAALDASLRDDMTAARRLEAIATVILSHFWNRRKMIEFFQREEHFATRHEAGFLKRRESILRLVRKRSSRASNAGNSGASSAHRGGAVSGDGAIRQSLPPKAMTGSRTSSGS